MPDILFPSDLSRSPCGIPRCSQSKSDMGLLGGLLPVKNLQREVTRKQFLLNLLTVEALQKSQESFLNI